MLRSRFIILLSSPLSISSPPWLGMMVVLPLGCSKNIWLPCCRLQVNPSFSRILVSSFALSPGSRDIYTSNCWRLKNFVFMGVGFFVSR